MPNNNLLVDILENQDMSLKNTKNALAKSRNDQVKNKPPKDEIQKQTNIFHTAEELITQQTLVGTAQMRLTDPKDTEVKILVTQQMTVLNKEHLPKMPRHLSSRTLQTKKTTIPLVAYHTRYSKCFIRPTNFVLPHLWNNM